MSTSDAFAGVPGPLRTALERRGFSSLTAVQQAVIAADVDGRDLRISSTTGSGKTVALGLALAGSLMRPRSAARPAEAADRGPTAAAGPIALIITPTRELAMQVRDELQWLLAELADTRVEVVTGGTDIGAERRVLQRAPAVLVGTPGRLLDHIRRGALACDAIHDVVLDEADRMLEMGFAEELTAIIETLPDERRSHLVSATFSGVMQDVADRFQSDPVHVQGTALGQANADIDHVAHLVATKDRYAALVNALLLASGERVLVFVQRRDGAADLAAELAGDGFAALPFSGELSQAQRTRTLDAFRNGSIDVLVSTDVAARGIDVPDISMVVHMSPPGNADDYTHRSGRTGRAGRRGRSVLLVPPRAQRFVTRLLSIARVEADWQPVPTPAKVRKAITKRTRKALHARLSDETGPADKTLKYAELLLQEHDATTVVATLLEQAEPRLPRDPIAVRSMPPATLDDASDEFGRGPPHRRKPRRGAVQRIASRRGKARPRRDDTD